MALADPMWTSRSLGTVHRTRGPSRQGNLRSVHQQGDRLRHSCGRASVCPKPQEFATQSTLTPAYARMHRRSARYLSAAECADCVGLGAAGCEQAAPCGVSIRRTRRWLRRPPGCRPGTWPRRFGPCFYGSSDSLTECTQRFSYWAPWPFCYRPCVDGMQAPTLAARVQYHCLLRRIQRHARLDRRWYRYTDRQRRLLASHRLCTGGANR